MHRLIRWQRDATRVRCRQPGIVTELAEWGIDDALAESFVRDVSDVVNANTANTLGNVQILAPVLQAVGYTCVVRKPGL
jgi:hypothetical protein